VRADSNPHSPNPEQRKIFDTTVDHYCQGLADLDPCQLLLNVDGVAGSGKTYTIMQISVMLQGIAGQHDREAAYAINGSTLHSLLQLPVKIAFRELPPASNVCAGQLDIASSMRSLWSIWILSIGSGVSIRDTMNETVK
jgi:hypothetical protein